MTEPENQLETEMAARLRDLPVEVQPDLIELSESDIEEDSDDPRVNGLLESVSEHYTASPLEHELCRLLDDATQGHDLDFTGVMNACSVFTEHALHQVGLREVVGTLRKHISEINVNRSGKKDSFGRYLAQQWKTINKHYAETRASWEDDYRIFFRYINQLVDLPLSEDEADIITSLIEYVVFAMTCIEPYQTLAAAKITEVEADAYEIGGRELSVIPGDELRDLFYSVEPYTADHEHLMAYFYHYSIPIEDETELLDDLISGQMSEHSVHILYLVTSIPSDLDWPEYRDKVVEYCVDHGWNLSSRAMHRLGQLCWEEK